MNKEINPSELDFLLRYPVQPGVTSPVDFLSNHSWGGIKVSYEIYIPYFEARQVFNLVMSMASFQIFICNKSKMSSQEPQPVTSPNFTHFKVALFLILIMEACLAKYSTFIKPDVMSQTIFQNNGEFL